MRNSVRVVLAAGLTALAAAAAAQGTGWHTIGQAKAAADSAKVVIAARGEPRNREIMFCIDGHGMNLLNATIAFEGGRTQSIKINERLADGRCSRGRPLSGRNKGAQSAEITYDPASLAGGTARVQLFVR